MLNHFTEKKLRGDSMFKFSHFYPQERHIPDQAHPIVFRMWKLQGAEPLMHFEIKTYVAIDGTPIAFDLNSGKQLVSNGDLEISVESPAKPNVIQKYNWKIVVRLLNGGVIFNRNVGFERMLAAPIAGYESEMVFAYQQDSKPWSPRYNAAFYVKGRSGGIYGKLAIALTTDIVNGNSVPITLSGYINRDDSRNLEVDPSLVVEAEK